VAHAGHYEYTVGVMGATRYDITFTGRVQGVFFRATAQEIAGRYAVAGWVKNQSDGTVRCVVEGEPDELDRFLADLKHAKQANIAETRVNTQPATGEFESFFIKR